MQVLHYLSNANSFSLNKNENLMSGMMCKVFVSKAFNARYFKTLFSLFKEIRKILDVSGETVMPILVMYKTICMRI